MQTVTDNGTEFENKTVKETMEALNVSHITTSYYHPQSNAKVEHSHRTLHDILAKLIDNHIDKWDLYVNQALVAIRFHISESSKYSPYFLLYNRDVVFPLDNLLKPRCKSQGKETHQIALEQQYKTFMSVYRHMKQEKRKQAKYADRNSEDTEFKINDPVYYKNFRKSNKLQNNWQPYFRVIEKS